MKERITYSADSISIDVIFLALIENNLRRTILAQIIQSQFKKISVDCSTSPSRKQLQPKNDSFIRHTQFLLVTHKQL